MCVALARPLPNGGNEEVHGTGPGRKGLMETYKMASRLGPSHALDSRFLVLIALQAAHLARVHLGHVHVCVCCWERLRAEGEERSEAEIQVI